MENEDSLFLTAFESGELPRIAWTHRAHLRMAYLYLAPEPDANALLPIVRERIIAYNASHGNYTGYHETITAAFLHIVATRLLAKPIPTFDEFERENDDLFLNTEAVLLRYYSRETLLSDPARVSFVLPDREPLPLCAGVLQNAP